MKDYDTDYDNGLDEDEIVDWLLEHDNIAGLQDWDAEGKMLGHIPYIHYCTSEAECYHIRNTV